MRVYYHGTSHKQLTAILKEGLKPHGSHGSDDWANEHGHEFPRRPYVFVASTHDGAVFYAELAAKENHSSPVVLILHLPENIVRALKHDDHSCGNPDFEFEGMIPPECIVGHDSPSKDEEDMANLEIMIL